MYTQFIIITPHTLLNNIEKNDKSSVCPFPTGDTNYKLQGPINESTSI